MNLNLHMKKIILFASFFINYIYAECIDLNYADCIYWSEYCEWNDETNQCQDIDGNDSNNNYGPFQFSSFNESDGLISSDNYLAATVFYPEPAVDSCVLKIEPKSNVIVKDVEVLKEVTKKAFNQRRKKIRNSLKKIENISFYLNKLGINENTRAQDIAVDLYCDLANLIFKKTNI